jgi:hypothetical protein
LYTSPPTSFLRPKPSPEKRQKPLDPKCDPEVTRRQRQAGVLLPLPAHVLTGRWRFRSSLQRQVSLPQSHLGQVPGSEQHKRCDRSRKTGRHRARDRSRCGRGFRFEQRYGGYGLPFGRHPQEDGVNLEVVYAHHFACCRRRSACPLGSKVARTLNPKFAARPTSEYCAPLLRVSGRNASCLPRTYDDALEQQGERHRNGFGHGTIVRRPAYLPHGCSALHTQA